MVSSDTRWISTKRDRDNIFVPYLLSYSKGDVIFTGDEFFVGVSNRTNSFAVAAMASVFNQVGFLVFFLSLFLFFTFCSCQFAY